MYIILYVLVVRFIVIDEAHCYKGAFGCNSALIFRRLRRICSHGTFPISLYIMLVQISFSPTFSIKVILPSQPT